MWQGWYSAASGGGFKGTGGSLMDTYGLICQVLHPFVQFVCERVLRMISVHPSQYQFTNNFNINNMILTQVAI